MSEIDIYVQIECVKRELRMRRRVYPRLIEKGKMEVVQAEAELKTMEAVLATLEEIASPKLPLP